MSGKFILTHIAAMVVGWACVGHIIGGRESKQESSPSSVKTKSGGRSPGSKQNPAEDGPLARWMGNTPDPALVERLKHESVAEVVEVLFAKWADKDASEMLGLLSARDSVELNATLAELRELLLADPKGMRMWFEGLPDGKRQSFGVFLLDEKLASAIPDEQLDSWEKSDPDGKWVPRERGRRIGRSGDPEELTRILNEASRHSDLSKEVVTAMEAVANWPVDRANELVEVLPDGNPRTIRSLNLLLVRMPLAERMEFLDSLASTGRMKKNAEVLEDCRLAVAMKGVGMDLEERLKRMNGRLAFARDVESAAPELISMDINRLFSRDGLPESDSLQATLQKVRNGEMKADELLAEVATRLGKLAEGRQELVKEKVFQQLAKIAPDAAVTLMDGISARAVQDKALSLGFDPAGFESAAVILRAREPEAPNEVQDRFSGWGHKSFEGLARYGDAYVSWALGMPRSLDRDLVLSAIAIHLEKDDPERAAQLRAEKTYQSGWRPGMK